MFRFIHAADIHLDSPLRGLSRYETAPVETYRNASRRAFENLVDLALEEEVSFVLLAGDLLDGDWKDFNTGIFLSRHIGRLNRAGIPVLAVAGNHDAASQITKALVLPENMVLFPTARPGSESIEGISAIVHGQGYKTRQVDDNLAVGFPNAVKGMFNIGLLHTSLDGREGHADYAPCTVDDLRSKGYQYWALGHPHDFEVVEEAPWIVFPGCLQGRNIRERGPKGCVLVTVEDGVAVSIEHRVLDVVRWELCTVDLSDATELSELLDGTRSALATTESTAEGRPTAVRVVLEGNTPLARELRARPFKLEQQVRAVAAELGDEGLWVEKVSLQVSHTRELETLLAQETPLSSLLQGIITQPKDGEGLDTIGEMVKGIRSKLPLEIVSGETGIELDDPERIDEIARDAREMLIGRLLAEEGLE